MAKVDRAFLQSIESRFSSFLERIGPGCSIAVVCHNDVDGLAAGSILGRSLQGAGYRVAVHTTGKGQTAWSPEIVKRVVASDPAGVIVADFSPRSAVLLPGKPTLIVDHHRPDASPGNVEVISGYGQDPTPTSGLLAYWVCRTLGRKTSLRWLAALSIIADLAESSGFRELEEELAAHGHSVLRDVTALLNAPRRSSSGEAGPALELLMKVNGPGEILEGRHPEVDLLKQAKTEVQAALQRAKMAAPKFSGQVAIIRIDTPCQVHPVIAQIWKSRLPKYIVMCANTGYRPGFVHFSVRSATEVNLLDFLREHAPADADDAYGGGHDKATGGALHVPAWNQFVTGLGFGSELLV